MLFSSTSKDLSRLFNSHHATPLQTALSSLAHRSNPLSLLKRPRAALSASTVTDDFEVVGTKIYDPNGQEFIAKGVNINGPGYGWAGNTPQQVENVKRWGFNAIRLNVRELGLEPKAQYAQNGTIDEIVQNYTNQGIVVVIEAHEKTGDWFTGRDLSTLASWHTDLATRYKDNPYVWLNVSNEPGDESSGSSIGITNYLRQNKTAIKAIRATGFDNPIVVDGWFWGQDSGAWNSDPVVGSKSAVLSLGSKILAADSAKNIVFSLHCYDQWRYGSAKISNYINRVHGKGFAMILGEYGAENGSSGRFQDTVSSVLPVAQRKEVGRFAWAWQGGDAFDLTLTGGGYKANFQPDGSMPDNLSWFGQQVWKDTHRVESLQPRPTTETAPTLVSPTTTAQMGAATQPSTRNRAYQLMLGDVNAQSGESTFTLKVK